MTDEERKAIEFTKYLVKDYKKQLELLEKNGANNYGYSDEEIDVIKYRNKQFEILLNLINKQEKAIDRMAKHIEKFTGSCPLDKCLWEECNKECENQMAECWKEYFMEDKE